MSIVPWRRKESMVRDWEDLPSVFNRLFDGRWFDQLPEAVAGGRIPPVNLAEDEGNFTVNVEIPGMNEKDINVQLMGNQLVISGEKKFEEEKKGKDYHRVEAQYGSFSRTVVLPREVRGTGVKAAYRNGILTVTIPKQEPTPASRIEVKAG